MAKARCARIADALVQERIRFPGYPQLVVTRAFAFRWLVDHGAPAHGGFASADYMAFGARAVSEPLTDAADRDAMLLSIEG